MRILIIYYSLNGKTKKIADILASKFNADIERIRDRRPRRGIIGNLRNLYQTLFSKRGKIHYVTADPDQYELTILGAPIWMMKLAAPMRSYIFREGQRFNKVAFFCTENTYGASGVFKTMQILCAKYPIAVLEVTKADIKSTQMNQKIDTFVSSCQQYDKTGKFP
jgi:flavodoxin